MNNLCLFIQRYPYLAQSNEPEFKVEKCCVACIVLGLAQRGPGHALSHCSTIAIHAESTC